MIECFLRFVKAARFFLHNAREGVAGLMQMHISNSGIPRITFQVLDKCVM